MAGIPGPIRRSRSRALIALAMAALLAGAIASPANARMRSKLIDDHLCKTVGGGRFVDIPGFPGEEIDRRLLADVRWMKRRYHIFITDGYSTDPAHARNGEHPIGLAADIVPNRDKGGTWSDLGALARKAEPEQDQPIPPWRWVGWNGDPNHGRKNHLHLSWMHSETKPEDPARVVYTRKCPEPPEEPPPSTEPKPRTGGISPTAFRRSSTGGTAVPHLPRRLRVKLAPKVPRSTSEAPNVHSAEARRTVQPAFESGPRAFASWLARARPIRGTCPLPLKAASFRI